MVNVSRESRVWLATLLIAASLAIHPLTARQQTAVPPESRCAVSSDPTYGLIAENPVRIGGGPSGMAVRQRQYLDALRGPAGEVVSYNSRGSRMVMLAVGETIIDAYPVTLQRGGRMVTVYLDGYHYATPVAPSGFICVQPISLPPPGPDALLVGTSVVELAIEQGATRDFDPILLSAPDGPRVAVMDQFRVLAYLSRLAARAGAPWDPKHPPTRGGTAVIAYPQQCNGQDVTAKEIDLHPPQGPPLPRGEYLNETSATTLLPRIELPKSTLVATFGVSLPRPTDALRVVYDRPPCGTTQTTDLPIVATAVRFTENPPAHLPAGHAPVTERVLLQTLVDTDGHVQKAVYIGGPEDLISAAMTAVATWRAEPARINGAPVVTPGMIAVPFQ